VIPIVTEKLIKCRLISLREALQQNLVVMCVLVIQSDNLHSISFQADKAYFFNGTRIVELAEAVKLLTILIKSNPNQEKKITLTFA